MFNKIASTFVTKVLTAIINLVVAVLISRWAGAEGKGIQGLFIATLGMILTLTGIFGPISITYLFNKKPSLNFVFISNLWAIVISLIIFLVLKAVPLIPIKYVPYLAVITFLASIATNNLSVFLIKERITKYNLALFSQPLFNVFFIVGFYLYKNSFSIEDYLYSIMISYCVLFIYSLSGIRSLVKEKLSLNLAQLNSDVKSMFRYGILNQLATIVQMISFRGSYFILDKYVSINDVGIYSNAVSIAESVWLISRSLSLVFYARMINTQSESYHKRIYKRFSSMTFWFQILALAVLISIPASFYIQLFGDEFSEIKSIIIYLIPAILFFGQALISGHYFSGTGKHHINLLSNSIGMIILICLSLILIPLHSVYGAAIATGFGFLGLLLVQYFFLRRYINVSLFGKRIDSGWLKAWIRSIRGAYIEK